jgi:hypothetical protein
MARHHALPPFPGNHVLALIISFSVGSFYTYWIRGGRVSVPKFRGAIMAIALLFPLLSAHANQPDSTASSNNSRPTVSSPGSSAEPPAVRTGDDSRPIVIGFLGGYVRHDDAVHTTVQVAKSLRDLYPTAIYGHSWGACAVVSLARQLKSEGIPVVLTVQVDSVSKAGRDDQTIPDNVRYAANFYQDKGFIRGQQKIVAADASRTKILGNFFFDYSAHPIACPEYPWYTRFFMRSHIEIECDQKVWQRVENLIREQLPTALGSAPAVPSNNATASNTQPAESTSPREQ